MYGLGLLKLGKYTKAMEVLNQAWEARGIYDLEIKRDIQEVEKALEHETAN